MAERDSTIDWDGVDAMLHPFYARMAQNLKETGHPLHHLTRSGVIVDSDPHGTPLHYEHLWEAGIPFSVPKAWRFPKKAKLRVEDWYNTRAGQRWLRKQSKGDIVEAAPAWSSAPIQSTLW